MNTPVAFIIFNRPEKTKRVFQKIADAKPRKLFVVADGPRENYPQDAHKCESARSVINLIDWDCELYTNFSKQNLGCGIRPSTGISWVFEHVDRAIILEDDCLPDQTFFRYCDELLDRYADNPQIMQINGTNLQLGKVRTTHSYYYSTLNICWGGWASWRRAWQYFDIKVRDWPAFKNTEWLSNILKDKKAVQNWSQYFDQAFNSDGEVSFWDFQWRFGFWKRNGLAISPRSPLIANIGYDPEGTHTKNQNNPYAKIMSTKMQFPLRHPSKIKPNAEADRFIIKQERGEAVESKRSFLRKVLSKTKNRIRKLAN